MIDFLVIGGGIAGISAAARLSHNGKVTVLEAESGLGYHASGRSAALYEATYGKPTTVALNLASKDYLAHANGGVLSPRGLLLIGRDQDRDVFEADLSGMKIEPINMAEAINFMPILNPDIVTFAGYHADAFDIDTDRLIQNFAREVRENGGQVLTGSRVTSIERSANGWRVATLKSQFTARILVNASGAWVDGTAKIAGIAPLGFTPLRRSMARLPAPGGRDVSKWPMTFAAGERWYCKPDAGKLLVSPSEEHPQVPHDAWPDDMVLAEGLARYEECVTKPVTRVETSWAGLRTFSPDRCLVLGPDPVDASFIWVAGQGGYGFQTSAAASQLVADLVTDQKPQLDEQIVAALSPARFC